MTKPKVAGVLLLLSSALHALGIRAAIRDPTLGVIRYDYSAHSLVWMFSTIFGSLSFFLMLVILRPERAPWARHRAVALAYFPAAASVYLVTLYAALVWAVGRSAVSSPMISDSHVVGLVFTVAAIVTVLLQGVVLAGLWRQWKG